MEMRDTVDMRSWDVGLLSFDAWSDTQSGSDYLVPEYWALTNWVVEGTPRISGTSAGWLHYDWQIPYSRMHSFAKMGFQFVSDGSVVKEGIYIDEIRLKEVDITIDPGSSYISPAIVSPGETFILHYYVHNPTSVSLQCGLGATVGSNIIDVANDHMTTLLPGYTDVSRRFTVPTSVVPGTYDVTFGLWSGMPGDTSNGNRMWASCVKASALTVQYKPDLTVEDLWIEDSYGYTTAAVTSGQPFNFYALVKNVGKANAVGTFSTTLYLDERSESTVLNTGGLNAGSSVTLKWTDCYLSSVGIHAIRADTDSTNTIAESNEINNSRPESVNILAAQWTVVAFMSSGGGSTNSLDPILQGDLEQMDVVGSSPSLSIAALADFSQVGDTKAYFIGAGKRTSVSLSSIDPIWTNEVNMADYHSLTSFGVYAFERFKAGHYALFLTDHGAGIDGIMHDGDAGQLMEINEMVIALSSIVQSNGGKKIDLLALEACGMGSVEISFETRNLADVLISSQVYIWGKSDYGLTKGGFLRYEAFLTDLKNNPFTTARDLSNRIVDTYVDWWISQWWDKKSVTLAAIDEGEVNSLATLIDELARSLNSKWSMSLKMQVNQSFDEVEKYDTENCADLYDLTQHMYSNIPDDGLRVTLAKIQSLFSSVVIKNRHYTVDGDISVDNANGLKISISGFYYGDTILSFLDESKWDEFLTKYWSPITITSPNGGEVYDAGTSRVITWTYWPTNMFPCRIELLKGSLVIGTISDLTENDGSFVWNIDKSLDSGADYRLRIESIDGTWSDESDDFFTIVGVPSTIPSPPSNLIVQWNQDLHPAGARGLYLAWNAPASSGGTSITRYDVYKGESSGSETHFDSVPISIGEWYVDVFVDPGNTYFYYVTASNSIGESGDSNEVSYYVPPPPPGPPSSPQNLEVSWYQDIDPTQRGLYLVWGAPSSDGGSPIQGYNIYRGISPGGESLQFYVQGASTHATVDTTIGYDLTYYYYATALNSACESAPSNEVSYEVQPNPDPGSTSSLAIQSGTGSFLSVSSLNEIIVAGPGEMISGDVTFLSVNTWASSAAMVYIGTPSWGDSSQSYWTISVNHDVGTNTYASSGISLTAPSIPGTYYLILAFRAELNGAQVASATNWLYGDPVWDDGNDIADFNEAQIAEAQANGRTSGSWLLAEGYTVLAIPADAITLVVQPPPQRLDIHVSTDKLVYTTGEPVNISVSIMNNGLSTAVLTFPSTIQGYFTVADSLGNPVYDYLLHVAGMPVITDLVLLSGQTAYYNYTWIQVSDDGTQVPSPQWYTIKGFVGATEVKLQNTTSIVIAPASEQFSLALKAGWNFVSVPLVNDSIKASTLGLHTGDIVAAWDSVAQEYGQTYVIGVSGPAYDFSIEQGVSYMIWVSVETQIVVKGISPEVLSSCSISLTVSETGGWTCIGLVSLASTMHASDLASCVSDANVLFVSKWNSTSSAYEDYVVGTSPSSYDFEIKPGEGYWIWIDHSGVLEYTP
jgi:hypothetical protein